MADADRLAICHPEFLEDLQHWVEQYRRTARRLMQLMKAVMRDPFDGIGKPERGRAKETRQESEKLH